MPFAINTNVASLQAQNYLRVTNDFQAKTIARVTSGLRIVNSGDDAAGLAIANGYRSDEAVLTQGVRNANDGLSQLQTADGGISNISQLLDRARTLATQSSSGAFTGDRSVLNSEFQSVIGEINRQAQAIGLVQGGTLAKSLNIFIGGGQTVSGVSAGVNGSVGLDLSGSTVDAASLGLQGVQAVGTAGTDIGSGGTSAGTSLTQILSNATNTGSVSTPGFSTFLIKGPGFDGGVTLTVNTANLGGTSDLVSAVNAAIQAAGNGGTQQATALKNAGITASINQDASGKQQLAFNSPNVAFQVQAGDRLANALLGNFGVNAVAASTDTTATVDTTTNHSLTFAIDGASPFAVSTLTAGIGTSKGQLVTDLNAAAAFNTKAVASLQGNQIVITTKGNTSSSSVLVTGALATALGFSGTASTAAAASTGANLATTVQGANAIDGNANIIGTDAGATATIGAGTNTLILTVGSSGAQTLTLTQGANLTKADIAADINTQIAAAGGGNAFAGTGVANGVVAKVVNNQIVLEAKNPGTSVTVGAGTSDAALGFTASTTSSTHTLTNSDTITLRIQGGGLTSPVDITLNPATAGTTTTAGLLADLQTKIAGNSALTAAGITLTSSTLSNNLAFTSKTGQQFQVLATGDSANVLGLGSFQSGANGAVDYSTITAGTAYSTSAASGTASFEVSLNGNASSGATSKFSADLTAGDATAAKSTAATPVVLTGGVVDLSGATGNLTLRVDGGASQTIALGTSATTSVASILSAIGAATGVGSATLDASGNLVITSATKGSNSSIEITNGDAPTTTALGLTIGTTHGTNASETNVIQQLNGSIAASPNLVAAGLTAQDDPNNAGHIQIVSSNGTNFRLNSYGAGNVGFTNNGATFTGNAQSAAPSVSPYLDSQGANASATLAYTNTLYGTDSQTVNITANDTGGTKHTLSVTIGNGASNRDQSIDQALSAINTQLQQSNDSTLNRIVAVKEDSPNGTQSIRFLSTVAGFQVSVSSDPNGTGITPPTGNQTTATAVGTGANADIGTVDGASAAVTALATAVSALGKAQAVVGRGENQLNYAVNLASSQLTNLAAAESRIRDADLAAESANLTKSQLLLQAGIAALAQANSAPQQVLKLLQ
jgi:flagellin